MIVRSFRDQCRRASGSLRRATSRGTPGGFRALTGAVAGGQGRARCRGFDGGRREGGGRRCHRGGCLLPSRRGVRLGSTAAWRSAVTGSVLRKALHLGAAGPALARGVAFLGACPSGAAPDDSTHPHERICRAGPRKRTQGPPARQVAAAALRRHSLLHVHRPLAAAAHRCPAGVPGGPGVLFSEVTHVRARLRPQHRRSGAGSRWVSETLRELETLLAGDARRPRRRARPG